MKSKHNISDYMLHIKAGPSLSQLESVAVNHEDTPVKISNSEFNGYLTVRMRNFSGICPTGNVLENPTSGYFQSRQRLYSISVQGHFTHDIPGDDLIWRLDLSGPVRTPPGTSIALKIAKWLEPSLEYNLQENEPWLSAPLVSTMHSVGVYDKKDFIQEYKLDVKEQQELPWTFSTQFIPENTSKLVDKQFRTCQERKRFFANGDHRQQVTFKAGDVCCFEFYDAHFDFSQMKLLLPGFSLNAFKYWDDQEVRFSLTNRSNTIKYFVCVFGFEKKSGSRDSEGLVKTELCSFSGFKIYPGHGKLFVRGDSRSFRFINGKMESLFMQRKKPSKLDWTVVFRRLHKKGLTEEVAKKRLRRNVKVQRAIVGADLETIKAKRNMKPEVRAAQREQLIKAIKEKKKAEQDKKKAEKAKLAQQQKASGKPKVSKQQAKGSAPKVQAKSR